MVQKFTLKVISTCSFSNWNQVNLHNTLNLKYFLPKITNFKGNLWNWFIINFHFGSKFMSIILSVSQSLDFFFWHVVILNNFNVNERQELSTIMTHFFSILNQRIFEMSIYILTVWIKHGIHSTWFLLTKLIINSRIEIYYFSQTLFKKSEIHNTFTMALYNIHKFCYIQYNLDI